MIRIGVISDTHYQVQLGYKMLKSMAPLNYLLHAGDMYDDGVQLGEMLQVETKVVTGNCDINSSEPDGAIITIGGKTIFLTHGHKYQVKSNGQSLLYKALELKADIVVYGHTHVPANFTDENIVFFNPGSATLPRGGASSPSVGLIEIDGKKINTKVIKINA